MTQQRIANQLDLLTEDVTITSAAGTITGRDKYPERLKMYEGWVNSHDVQGTNVSLNADGSLKLIASINYRNTLPDGESNAYTISYDTRLQYGDGPYGLPQFASLNLKPAATLEPGPLQDMYATNRVMALIHFYLFTVEGLEGDLRSYKALLTDTFILEYPAGDLTSWDALLQHVKEQQEAYESLNHEVEMAEISLIEPNTYGLRLIFNMQGTRKDGSAVTSKVAYAWKVIDNPDEEFARIAHVRSQVLQEER